MRGEELLPALDSAWAADAHAVARGESKGYGRLSGVYTGGLTWEEGSNHTTYAVVLCLTLLEHGTVSGCRYAADAQGRRLPDAVLDHAKSSWRREGSVLGGQHQAEPLYALRLRMTSRAHATSFLVECLANPRTRSLKTVTWQVLGGGGPGGAGNGGGGGGGGGAGGSGYHTGTDFVWGGRSVPEAQEALRARRAERKRARSASPPKKGGGGGGGAATAGATGAKAGEQQQQQPPAKRPRVAPPAAGMPTRKPASQVLTDGASSKGSLGIFCDEAEQRRATSYHQVHGYFPPDIQKRMVSQGLVKKADAGAGTGPTWKEVKDTFEHARRTGDGSMPEATRAARVREWLQGVQAPGPDEPCPGGGPPSVARSTRGQQLSPPQRAAAVPPLPPPPQLALGGSGAAEGVGGGGGGLAMPPPPVVVGDSSNYRASLVQVAPSPTYGFSPAYGESPAYQHSAQADVGDDTPAYGEPLGASPRVTGLFL
eukprot:Rhum_TRINITY_DN14511_c8_g2::Rhum_TRINITY_DN14511_c8_g2_i1::g.93761::m.93761